jgi:hypothetical protein
MCRSTRATYTITSRRSKDCRDSARLPKGELNEKSESQLFAGLFSSMLSKGAGLAHVRLKRVVIKSTSKEYTAVARASRTLKEH